MALFSNAANILSIYHQKKIASQPLNAEVSVAVTHAYTVRVAGRGDRPVADQEKRRQQGQA